MSLNRKSRVTLISGRGNLARGKPKFTQARSYLSHVARIYKRRFGGGEEEMHSATKYKPCVSKVHNEFTWVS